MARNGNAKTKHVALNMLKVSVAISGAALLFACGDDDSSFVASENGGSAAEAESLLLFSMTCQIVLASAKVLLPT